MSLLEMRFAQLSKSQVRLAFHSQPHSLGQQDVKLYGVLVHTLCHLSQLSFQDAQMMTQ